MTRGAPVCRRRRRRTDSVRGRGSAAKISTATASDRGPNDPATTPATAVPADAPIVRHTPFTSTAARLRAPLQTRNAVSATQARWSGHSIRPPVNAVASAAAISSECARRAMT
ncbi:hypothetical protein [Streptomyces antimycoticus]|uniref:hypothetical protein n=1 Tax=Streptomyces antimycoticus TaxID=68175 RepID=UPI000F771516|nr:MULTISPECIES: hypothetical protein [Streptomyces]RSS44733.1 hypothetical protein EF902_15855 [Streptomyces sp. WAC05858]WJE01838.1 hypothetical protein QR300_41270 [Streptomyces antimycoticus]WTA78780.1 hypothetical protein OG751_01565 [Streptomyces antimycoticus]